MKHKIFICHASRSGHGEMLSLGLLFLWNTSQCVGAQANCMDSTRIFALIIWRISYSNWTFVCLICMGFKRPLIRLYYAATGFSLCQIEMLKIFVFVFPPEFFLITTINRWNRIGFRAYSVRLIYFFQGVARSIILAWASITCRWYSISCCKQTYERKNLVYDFKFR